MTDAKAITPFEDVKNNLVRMADTFKPLLPAHITVEKFITAVQLAIAMEPKLLTVKRISLYHAIQQAAHDGLIPDKREGVILPFGDEAKWMPMVGGICKKIRNSGEISVVDAVVVYENDEYDMYVDEKGTHWRHRKARSQRGKPVLTYAYAIAKDGGVFFEEIDEEQMDAIEKKALEKIPVQNQKYSPYKGPFKDEMRRKAGLRRLGKYRLPSSSEVQELFQREDADILETTAATSEEPAPAPKPSRLAGILESQNVSPAPEPEGPPVDAGEPSKWEAPPTADTSEKVLKGLIEELKIKEGTTNGKTWTKYGVKVGKEWIGTFDTAIYEAALDHKANRRLVNVGYEESEKGGKVYKNIVSLSVQTLDQVRQEEEDPI